MNNIQFEHLPHDVCRITSAFGYRVNPITGSKGSYHQGLDIGAKVAGVQGDKLYAVAKGVVVWRGNMASKVYGYGYYTIIQHKGFCALYAHMMGLILNVGDLVHAGQIVGYMGSTGASTAAHLHFEVEPIQWNGYLDYIAKDENMGIRKYAVNPYNYISAYRATVETSKTIAEVEEMANEVIRYKNIKEMPEWMQPYVQKWVAKGYIKGNDKGELNFTEDMMRTLIIAERMNQA